jgi:hypothetical protein
MILDSPLIDTATFEQKTGWALKPQGACKAEMCVPLGAPVGDTVDVRQVAERLGMPVIESDGVLCVGPESIGRALQSVEAPNLVLPDRNGTPFALDSLRGQKVLLLAWASW